LKSNL